MGAVSGLIEPGVNSTLGRTFYEKLYIFLGSLVSGAAFGIEGASIGVNLAEGLHIYNFLRYHMSYELLFHRSAHHIYRFTYEDAFGFLLPRHPPSTNFVIKCGFAGAATAVVGAIVGAIVGEKVGEAAAERVLGEDIFKGYEEVVGAVTGFITGGITGALVGALIGFCIAGPVGAFYFRMIGLKTGAEAGLVAGAISGGLAGADKGEEIAQKRTTNI